MTSGSTRHSLQHKIGIYLFFWYEVSLVICVYHLNIYYTMSNVKYDCTVSYHLSDMTLVSYMICYWTKFVFFQMKHHHIFYAWLFLTLNQYYTTLDFCSNIKLMWKVMNTKLRPIKYCIPNLGFECETMQYILRHFI